MRFTQVNPRDLSTLQGLDAATTMGVEVTIPTAAAVCGLGNLDHHGQHDTVDTASACMQALDWMQGIQYGPEVAAIPATVLWVGMDVDTLTSLAVLHLGALGLRVGSISVLTVYAVDMIDRHGPHAFPEKLDVYGVRELYALIHAAGRITTPEQVDALVAKAATVLQGAAHVFHKEASAYADALAAVADRAIVTMENLADGTLVALVESPDFAAVQHGYQFADVVIATNPNMRGADGSTYLKRTIAVRDSNVGIDLKKVYPVLNSLQPGWGGHSLIGGSPVGVDCTVPISAILAALSGH